MGKGKKKKAEMENAAVSPPPERWNPIRIWLAETLKRAGLIAAALALSFLICEVWLRIHPPREFARLMSRSFILQPDDLLGLALRPDLNVNIFSEGKGVFHIETNSLGLRDEPYPGKGNRRNILGLGDSFLFGDGVARDEAFLSRIQKALEDRFPGKYRAVNAGVPSYSTNQEVLYYLARGDALFDPDVIILFFYMNDLTFYVNDKPRRYYHGIPVPEADRVPHLAPERQSSWRAVNFFRFLRKFLVSEGESAMADGVKTDALPIEAALLDRNTFPLHKTRVRNFSFMLGTLKKKAAQRGAKVLVVYLPSAFETEEGAARKSLYTSYKVHPSVWDWEGLNREIEKTVLGQGIAFVNLVPPFQEQWRQTQESLFFNGTGHLTSKGHQVAAEFILKKLETTLENPAPERTDTAAPAGSIYDRLPEGFEMVYRIGGDTFLSRTFVLNSGPPARFLRFFVLPQSDSMVVSLYAGASEEIRDLVVDSQRGDLKQVDIPIKAGGIPEVRLVIRSENKDGGGVYISEPRIIF